MNNNLKNEFRPVIIGLTIAFIGMFMLFIGESAKVLSDRREEAKIENEKALTKAFNDGKFVGRTAVILYVTTQSEDTVKIYLEKLLEIDDSLSVPYYKNYKK